MLLHTQKSLAPDVAALKLATLRRLRDEGRALVTASEALTPALPMLLAEDDTVLAPPERALSGLKALAQAGFEEPANVPPNAGQQRQAAVSKKLSEMRRLRAEATRLLTT